MASNAHNHSCFLDLSFPPCHILSVAGCKQPSTRRSGAFPCQWSQKAISDFRWTDKGKTLTIKRTPVTVDKPAAPRASHWQHQQHLLLWECLQALDWGVVVEAGGGGGGGRG